jgi:putative transposase
MKRKIEFANGENYHICNRGADKREIFSCDGDYLRFLLNCRKFNVCTTPGVLRTPGVGSVGSVETPLVEIVAYCLNHNHYHFILKQLVDDGISDFMHRVSMGYSKYYNRKNSRSGVLFQGPFKAVHIDTNEYFLYVSAYVNMNHFIHGYTRRTPGVQGTPGVLVGVEEARYAIENPWGFSSLPDYLGKRTGTLCDKSSILDQFQDAKEYETFLINNGLYLKDKKEMENYVLE